MSSLEQKSEVVEYRTFTHSFHEKAANVVQVPLVEAYQPAYSLSYQEFRDLITTDNTISAIITKLLTIAVGYAIILAAKYIAFLTKLTTSQIESWEAIAVVVAVILLLILYPTSAKFLPSKRKKLLQRVEKFFDDNPVSFRPYGEEQ
jgi:hypothetical protein